jgi:hypothetical protein
MTGIVTNGGVSENLCDVILHEQLVQLIELTCRTDRHKLPHLFRERTSKAHYLYFKSMKDGKLKLPGQ